MQDKFKDRIEGLTWKLPKLKQRSAFKEASAKANNDLKKKKEERRQKFSLKSKNIVGQPAPKITAEKPGKSKKCYRNIYLIKETLIEMKMMIRSARFLVCLYLLTCTHVDELKTFNCYISSIKDDTKIIKAKSKT